MAPSYHIDDLRQEIFVILLEKDKELIVRLYDEKKLIYYVVRILINLLRQKNNTYHKQYITGTEELIPGRDSPKLCEEPEELEIRRIKEEDEVKALDKIDKMDEDLNTCYYRLLTVEYKKHGSMREISRRTGIPIKSISNSFKKIRKHLAK